MAMKKIEQALESNAHALNALQKVYAAHGDYEIATVNPSNENISSLIIEKARAGYTFVSMGGDPTTYLLVITWRRPGEKEE